MIWHLLGVLLLRRRAILRAAAGAGLLCSLPRLCCCASPLFQGRLVLRCSQALRVFGAPASDPFLSTSEASLMGCIFVWDSLFLQSMASRGEHTHLCV